METIGWGRRTGKTTKMIDWWLEDPDNRIIVCATASMRRHTLTMLRELFTFDEGIWRLAQQQFHIGTGRLRGSDGPVGADNFDLLPRWDRNELVNHPRFLVYTVNE